MSDDSQKENIRSTSATACPICSRHCMLSPGQTGKCRARTNRDGHIVSLNYGKITSLAVDPIEKKPLVRFKPGSKILSIGSFGCNLDCPFCQNADFVCASLNDFDTYDGVGTIDIDPQHLAAMALKARDASGSIGVAYTYNEPFVGFEYVRDCAGLIHSKGLFNVVVTNGLIMPDPLNEVLPYIDAMNIDLKCSTKEGYARLGHGDLASVQSTIRTVAACRTCHLEITMLIVPGFNDQPEEVEHVAAWIASVDRSIPFHVTRFFPAHRMMNVAPTPVDVVYNRAELARNYLDDVIVGNC
ncbi:MAG: AmmeMemoRadiSam system radical SAM enzyme [Eggerthellaceae bacterium]|nr:AmmeMemoRadiSam system radical SAM enzyme [Eggerthellaceae bacterium]MCH4221170.1 AmmeMemoRadiSam system radical SAM enzyme [Eggerthellaceae bacterium]